MGLKVILIFGLSLALSTSARRKNIAERTANNSTIEIDTTSKTASRSQRQNNINNSNSTLSKSSVDNQSKRDLSLSYSATDIGSKGGTHVKTITVIKNVFGEKQKPLKINPEHHKTEDWGSKIRDNFDAFGTLPDVPDIDDLFEFVNKKKPKAKAEEKAKEKQEKTTAKPIEKPKGEDKKDDEKDVSVEVDDAPEKEKASKDSSAEESPVESDEAAEKIKGDAELIPNSSKQVKLKSQSLDIGKYRVSEPGIDDSYTTPTKQNLQQYYNNYIQPKPYYYPKPDNSITSISQFPSNHIYNSNGNKINGAYWPTNRPQQSSFIVTTSSGRSYDIPINNNGTAHAAKPYIAPSIVRKTQININQQNNPSNFGPQFPNQQNLTNPQQFPSSSQTPYIAPNLRKSCNTNTAAIPTLPLPNTGQPPQQSYPAPTQVVPIPPLTRNIPPNFRSFNPDGDYRPYPASRFRGLKIKKFISL